jgi:hypothetical protein
MYNYKQPSGDLHHTYSPRKPIDFLWMREHAPIIFLIVFFSAIALSAFS